MKLTEAQADVLRQVLIYHPRHTPAACLCGWSVLGASHADHVIEIYQQCLATLVTNPKDI